MTPKPRGAPKHGPKEPTSFNGAAMQDAWRTTRISVVRSPCCCPSRRIDPKAFGPGAGSVADAMDASELTFQARISVVVCCHDEAARLPEFANGLRPALDTGRATSVSSTWWRSTTLASRPHRHQARCLGRAEDPRWRVDNLARTARSKPSPQASRKAKAVVVLLDADCVPVDTAWLANMTHRCGDRLGRR